MLGRELIDDQPCAPSSREITQSRTLEKPNPSRCTIIDRWLRIGDEESSLRIRCPPTRWISESIASESYGQLCSGVCLVTMKTHPNDFSSTRSRLCERQTAGVLRSSHSLLNPYFRSQSCHAGRLKATPQPFDETAKLNNKGP